jgi:hypothetical protein
MSQRWTCWSSAARCGSVNFAIPLAALFSLESVAVKPGCATSARAADVRTATTKPGRIQEKARANFTMRWTLTGPAKFREICMTPIYERQS